MRSRYDIHGMMVAGLFVLALQACGRVDPGYQPEYSAHPARSATVYRFGVHPLHNPQRIEELYGPIVSYINTRLRGASLKLEASKSYEEFEKKLYSGHFHFALPDPYQALVSQRHGYRVFAKMGEDSQYHGLILVRRDGGIMKMSDLRGKAVSFPAPTALAATLMPLCFLRERGVDIDKDIERVYSGSQESAIMNVYLGKSVAAATWPQPWETFKVRSPDIASQLEVRWRTKPLVNNAIVVRSDIPQELVRNVSSLLCGMHLTQEGRVLLSALPLKRFERATAATYLPVESFMRKYAAAPR